jgi:hypothetical protein
MACILLRMFAAMFAARDQGATLHHRPFLSSSAPLSHCRASAYQTPLFESLCHERQAHITNQTWPALPIVAGAPAVLDALVAAASLSLFCVLFQAIPLHPLWTLLPGVISKVPGLCFLCASCLPPRCVQDLSPSARLCLCQKPDFRTSVFDLAY